MYPYPLIALDYNNDDVFLDDLSIDEDALILRISSSSGIAKKSIAAELRYHESQENIRFAVLVQSSMAYYELLKDIHCGCPFEIEINKKDIATRLDVSVLVYTKKIVDINFNHIDTHLPSSVILPANSFLGELCSFRYWLAHERERSVASIIRLDLNSENYSFDLDMNKISVKIPKYSFESYPDIKGNGNLIFALYVYPVLVRAMSLVLDYRANGQYSNLESLKWFEYLQMKIETTGINESNPIVACQDLIPINIQEEVIKMIYENSDEQEIR